MTEVTAEQVLACDDPDRALELAFCVPEGGATAGQVLACRFPDAALELACCVPVDTVTADQVLACRFPGAASALACCVPYSSVTPGDILACRFEDVVSLLQYRVPTHKRPAVLAAHDNYELRIWGQDPNTCWVMAGCRALRGTDEALKHWDRDDERARLFTRAIRDWEEEKGK